MPLHLGEVSQIRLERVTLIGKPGFDDLQAV
jgi:hypothetical protein